jgi:type I restriction enzyme S subunit
MASAPSTPKAGWEVNAWPAQKIQDCCLVTDYVANGSFAALRENVEYLNGDGFAILIRFTDFTKNWNGNYRFVSQSTYKFLNKSSLIPGDLVMSNVGDPGRVFVVPDLGKPMTLGPNSVLIRPLDGGPNHSFLYYYFSSDQGRTQISSITAGAAQKKFNKTSFRKLDIPIPPLAEQERIVGILDEAFEGIAAATAQAEKNLHNARELFQSVLQSTFSQKGDDWEETTLETDNKFIDYRGRTPKKTDSGLRLITAKNVRMGFLQREPEEFVAPESYDSWMTRGIPQIEDVLFTTEAPLGLVCQLDTEEKVVFAQRIITLQPERSVIDPAYLKWTMMSPIVQSRIHEKATGATAQGIKSSLLKKIIIPRAPLPTQQAIVEKLDALSEETKALEAIYERKQSALAELKQSLLQKAFAGEL